MYKLLYIARHSVAIFLFAAAVLCMILREYLSSDIFVYFVIGSGVRLLLSIYLTREEEKIPPDERIPPPDKLIAGLFKKLVARLFKK